MAAYFGTCWEGLLILRNALVAVVEAELKRVHGEDGWWKSGVAPRFDKQRQEQLRKVFEARHSNPYVPLAGDQKELLDITDLYAIIEGEWAKAFKGRWSKTPLPHLKEIVDFRNPLAHPSGTGIDRDMAKRFLQNCRFVLADVDADAAARIRELENSLDAPAGAASLKPWYAVATPHRDIREGHLDESLFAANLWAVVQGTAPEVYLDPEEFYGKTYITEGLAAALDRVSGALSGGDVGDRIISLQTAFGGGKTHTLVALWHFAKHCDRLRTSPRAEGLRRALKGQLPSGATAVAVFTNHTCDVTQGRQPEDGIHLWTLWGELAYQLGGRDLYERVRANDENRCSPQGLFVEVLRAASPCLILLDELADYCVVAAAAAVGDTTLADQTISFVQQLTEAVQQVPGSVVVATLPASKFEVAQSEKGQEAFVTLEKRFQRLGSDLKPVADEEIYDVVRARLFESIAPQSDPDAPRRVAQVYQNYYAEHVGEVPSEAAKSSYRSLIERSYPFHPSVVDTLYKRWGSHPDFQRTRGVLRLLASIVGDLWNRRHNSTDTQHLIQPCHIRWSIDALQAALTRYWGPAYQSVAAADAIGASSNAGTIDEERGGDYRGESIATGLASAVLLGSFGAQGGRSGFSAKELKLACARYGLNWNYIDGAILELENRCFYLHWAGAGSLGKRYWFSTKPSLNQLVVRYRQQSAKEQFEHEIIDDLRREVQQATPGAATWRVLVGPEDDLPEQKSLALLVLPPAPVWDGDEAARRALIDRVQSISSKCGAKDRIYRNTLLFLAGTTSGFSKLKRAYRERAALEAVRTEYGDHLDDDQGKDLLERLSAARQAVAEALGPAFSVILRVRAQKELEECLLTDARKTFAEHLSYLWRTLVEDEEWVLRRVGSVTLQTSGLIPEADGRSLKDTIEAFLRYTDKPMIATRNAVTEGLAQACADGVVGIARGPSLSQIHSRTCRQAIVLDPSEEGVWIIPPFEPEEEKPKPHQGQAGGAKDEGTGKDGGGKPEVAGAGSRMVRRIAVRGTVPVESWGELFRCFVGPAARMQLKRLQLGVQFEIELPDGGLSDSDPAVKAMKEAARQLGLDMETEE